MREREEIPRYDLVTKKGHQEVTGDGTTRTCVWSLFLLASSPFYLPFPLPLSLPSLHPLSDLRIEGWSGILRSVSGKVKRRVIPEQDKVARWR